MNISKLLKRLNETSELTVERAKELIIQELSIDEDDIKDFHEKTLKSAYNDYKCFGNYDYAVIKYEDYKNYVEDLANELAQKLPDKFYRYFNTDELALDMLDDFVLVKQTQEWLENQGETVDSITEIHNANDDCYILELL